MTRARDVANLIGSGNYSSTTFTATAGQTAFTISHTQGFIQVFMNGLLLDETVDYTSNGSAVTLTSGAAAGDEIEVVAYNTFSVGDAIAASGGTFTGNVAMSGTLGVTGATTLTGNTTVGGTLGATGKITSTAGITFGSDTAAENVLDDYEEGEYTPLLYGYTTGSGTLLPLRSTHNVLSYTKVGRKVSVNGKIETSGSHSAQGSLLLSIPFTSANLTDQAGQGAGSCFFYRTGQLHENPTVIFGEGVDYVYFFSNTSGGDVLGITADVMDTAIELIVGFTYFST